MNIVNTAPKIQTLDEGAISRRALMLGAPVAIAASVVAATPANPAEVLPAIAGDLADQIAHHVAEIERLLQGAAPQDVTLSGVQWTKWGGSFWASGHWVNPDDPYDYNLAHYRPIKGWWVQEPPRFIGGAV